MLFKKSEGLGLNLSLLLNQGVQSSRGEFILFADADGATRFSDLDKLYSGLHLLYRNGE